MADAAPGRIRVVMFGSGPALTPDARLFLCRLAREPRIELAGAFVQGLSRSPAAVLADLQRRRSLLALPLFVASGLAEAARFLRAPRAALQERRELAALASRIHAVHDVHASETLAAVRALAPDLGLVYGSPILKPALFGIPRLGTLGIHHGKVPEYRGNKTTFWAMANGERTAGVTIQKIEAGLDTGQIVQEGSVEIRGRSLGAVWRELEALGLDLYLRAILELADGRVTLRPQLGTKGKLYRNPKLADLLRFHASRWLRLRRRR